jgi:murein DD-endopeptidase MepM/ murein hydrolase activator NlpD
VRGRRGRIASLCGAAALAAGCAHGSGKQTFAEAGWLEPSEPDGPPAPPVKVTAPKKVASAPPAGPPIDSLLLPFAAEARGRRTRAPAGRGFPPEATLAWSGLALELDRYLDRPMPQTPLLELVRARVTVESELEFDRRRYGEPPPEVRDQVLPRLARLAARAEAARAVGKQLFARQRSPPLRWPVDDVGVSSRYGMRLHPLDGQRKMHWGVDLAAQPGRAVGAAGPGYVVQAGWMSGYGWLVEVRHPGDLTSRYSHLSRILCHPGDAVEAGQLLGLVGQTGKATGPHLHFEVWKAGKAMDPLGFLGARLALGRRR